MRSLRDIQTIVRAYPLAPDEEDLRRLCYKHMEHLYSPKDITDWITHVDNPYLRELYATETAIIVNERCLNPACPEEAWNLESYVREEIIEELTLIASSALGSQAGTEVYYAERLGYTLPLQEAVVQATPYLYDAREKLEMLSTRVDKLEETIKTPQIETPHWPYFTEKATDEDREIFEHFLIILCTKDTKGISGEIKSYLALKAQAGIIIRPKIIDIELDILRTFGYKSPDKTYYNA